MNIDLLMTAHGQTGLVCEGLFESPVAGVIFDHETNMVTLEHADLETTHLNIPVEDEIAGHLLDAAMIQIGAIADGAIQENRQVPLMLLNDPDGFSSGAPPLKTTASVTAFERFIKSCVTGQPLHRDDLGDEQGAGSVVGGLNRAVLEFAPHLARQRKFETTHDMRPGGPAAPGMRMGGSGGSSSPPPRQVRPAQKKPPSDGRDD